MPETLLIYAPVPLHRRDGSLLLEDQACNGLRLWCAHFERLIAVMPIEDRPPPPAWGPLSRVGPALERIEFVPVPVAWRPDRFLLKLPATRRRIREAIGRSDYCGFAIGGLFGDWGAVGCWEAHRLGRPYFVWTDRVESEVVRRAAGDGPWRSRLRARLTHRPMAWLERAVIRRAALGLFHGRETYDHYAPFCARPEVVHNIHIKRADHIAAAAVAAKIAEARRGPLRICYAGRAEAMKGPLDWIGTLTRLSAAGVDFEATWFGDGTYLPEMRRRVAEAGLERQVRLPGFLADRASLLEALRAAHVFLFCHLTPESPRNLIEALISACPIVGYDGVFARDLTTAGGGRFVPSGDVAALAAVLAALDADREALGALIAAAAVAGAPFDDESVFRHRSEVIKAALAPATAA